jgi:hypothetical protein
VVQRLVEEYSLDLKQTIVEKVMEALGQMLSGSSRE